MYNGSMMLLYRDPATDVYKRITLKDLVSQLRKAAGLDADMDVNTLSYDIANKKFVKVRVNVNAVAEHQKVVRIHLHDRSVLHVESNTPVFTYARQWVPAFDLHAKEDKVLSAGSIRGVDTALPLKVLKVEGAGMEEVFSVECLSEIQSLFINRVLVRPSTIKA